MVGHKLLVKNFKALIESGRLAQGYIFYGPEGAGKRTFALALASFLETGDFSNDSGGILGDLLFLGAGEGTSIGIDEVRKAKGFLYQKPNRSVRRTLVVDNADLLTGEAQNAFLKLAEDPPSSALVILIVREPELLAATLNSRFQKVYFASLKLNDVRGGLEKLRGMNVLACGERDAEEAAIKTEGSFGLALKLLNDKKFNDLMVQAENFLKVSGSDKKDFIKKLVEPDDFQLAKWLDALILVLSFRAQEYKSAQKGGFEFELWHRVLKLRWEVSNFPLNPRLQIGAL